MKVGRSGQAVVLDPEQPPQPPWIIGRTAADTLPSKTPPRPAPSGRGGFGVWGLGQSRTVAEAGAQGRASGLRRFRFQRPQDLAGAGLQEEQGLETFLRS